MQLPQPVVTLSSLQMQSAACGRIMNEVRMVASRFGCCWSWQTVLRAWRNGCLAKGAGNQEMLQEDNPERQGTQDVSGKK